MKHARPKMKHAKPKKAHVIAPCVLAIAVIVTVAFVPPLIDSMAGSGDEGESYTEPSLEQVGGGLWGGTAATADALDPAEEHMLEYQAIKAKEADPTQKQLEVPSIYQLPELRCGCEITSATALLQYAGFSVTHVEMNEYLAQGWDNRNPHEQFVGYCATSGWMCYQEPIVSALNSYLELSGQAGKWQARDISGTSVDELLEDYIAKNTPVCVWVTTYLQDRSIASSWYVGDELVTVSEQDHCMTLSGYTQDTVTLMDPLAGELVEYPKESFERSYELRGSRAVVLVEL